MNDYLLSSIMNAEPKTLYLEILRLHSRGFESYFWLCSFVGHVLLDHLHRGDRNSVQVDARFAARQWAYWETDSDSDPVGNNRFSGSRGIPPSAERFPNTVAPSGSSAGLCLLRKPFRIPLLLELQMEKGSQQLSAKSDQSRDNWPADGCETRDCTVEKLDATGICGSLETRYDISMVTSGFGTGWSQNPNHNRPLR